MTSLSYEHGYDNSALAKEYPLGDSFINTYGGMPVERLREIQEERFRRVVSVAWQTPFYRRLWADAGVGPGDIKSLADINHLPIFDKSDIVADVAEHPPFGSLAVRLDKPIRPRVLQTTSGTTGTPQPVLWSARSREIQNALLGRVYRWLGVGEDDVVHSVYGHGLVNGGHYVREAVVRYTDALLLSAGTGSETRSERQVAIMAQFGVTVLAGFGDYLRRLADVALAAGYVPGKDIPVRMIIGHVPAGSREIIEQAWPGAKVYDWYGIADTGVLASEGPDRDGQYLWEDANFFELLDTDSHLAVSEGEVGSIVVTSLNRDDIGPLIRFDTHDLTRVLSGGNAYGLPFPRITGLVGRSDQMVKLRGINVYPTAVAALIAEIHGVTGEYYCRLERGPEDADQLVVVVEAREGQVDEGEVAEKLSASLGVKVRAEIVGPGATAEVTGVSSRQKPLRLLDVR